MSESVSFTSGGELSQSVEVTAVADEAAEDRESVRLGFGTLLDGVEAGEPTSATVALVDGGSETAKTALTGGPTIEGMVQVDETLTASVSGIEDADGLDSATFAYQWVSNDGTDDTDIERASSSTFTDDDDTEERLVSAATEPWRRRRIRVSCRWPTPRRPRERTPLWTSW